MKPRLYFDISVFGGIYDEEFRFETEKLFEMVENGEIVCVYSDLTITELENAPEEVKMHFKKLPRANTLKLKSRREVFCLQINTLLKR